MRHVKLRPISPCSQACHVRIDFVLNQAEPQPAHPGPSIFLTVSSLRCCSRSSSGSAGETTWARLCRSCRTSQMPSRCGAGSEACVSTEVQAHQGVALGIQTHQRTWQLLGQATADAYHLQSGANAHSPTVSCRTWQSPHFKSPATAWIQDSHMAADRHVAEPTCIRFSPSPLPVPTHRTGLSGWRTSQWTGGLGTRTFA